MYDGAGEPVPDAILELWQADADGSVVQRAGSLRRDGWTFTGFGRASTDAEGRYTFTTVRARARRSSRSRCSRAACSTGCSPAPTCPTRPTTPSSRPLDADRRSTLLTTQDETAAYVFDVHLQGERETVFLAYPRHER